LLALLSSRLYPWSRPLKDDKSKSIAPGLDSILHSAKELGVAGAVVVTLLVLVVAVLARPIQFAAIQLLEGYGTGRGSGTVASFAIEFHARRRGFHLVRRTAHVGKGPDTPTFANVVAYSRRTQRTARMNERAEQVVADYPQRLELLMPTLLGNILRRMETTAGERYGLTTMDSYPRLYPYLSKPLESEIAVQLDALGSSATFVFVLGAQALASSPLVARLDGWSLLPLLFGVAAILSFRGTRPAARRYAQLIAAAYDLHRFDMLRAMHRPLPDEVAQEITENAKLSAFLRNDVATPDPEGRYDHSPTGPTGTAGNDVGEPPADSG
jgi:hypothetical protein